MNAICNDRNTTAVDILQVGIKYAFDLYLDFFQCAGQCLAKPSLG